MLNKMIIQGNIVATPELRETQSGKSVISFRLGWNETYKETKSELFINCVAWGYTAEFISKYFIKGSQIIVEGRLISRTYEDENTATKKYVTELVVDNCHFSGYRNSPQNESNDNKSQKITEDGDLPF